MSDQETNPPFDPKEIPFNLKPSEEYARLEEQINELDAIKNSKSTVVDESSRRALLARIKKVEDEINDIKEIAAMAGAADPNNALSWSRLSINIIGPLRRVSQLKQEILDIRIDGGLGDQESYEGRNYPFMGDFDLTKRFLLSPEVDLFEFEKVKDWGFGEIIQAINLYIDMYLSRDYHLDRPFSTQELLQMHVSIKPPEEDQRTMTLGEAITGLGQETTQVYLDRVKATQELTRQAANHQPLRISGGNAKEIVANTTLVNSVMEGLFDVEAEDDRGKRVEIRARGIPVTNAVLMRFIFASMYNRGFNEDKDGRKDRPTPFVQEGGQRLGFKKAFAQLVGGVSELLKYINKKIIEEGPNFIGAHDLDLHLQGLTYSKDWANSEEKFADDATIERVAKAAVAKALNLGDVLLLRAIHDLGASRHDELDLSRLLRYRSSQTKYFKYDQKTGIYERTEGSLEISDIGIIEFWESLYKPLIQRVRMRPIYLYKDGDEIKVGAAERQFHDVMCDWNIPNIGPLDDKKVKEIKKIYEGDGGVKKTKDAIFKKQQTEGDGADISDLNEQLKKLFEKLKEILDDSGLTIPEKNENSAYMGGVVITSLEDLIRTHYPKAIEDEEKVINHVAPVRDAISNWDFSLDNLVVKRDREGGGGSFVTFNPDLGDKIKKVLRSSFYYWIQDYTQKTLSLREYQELAQNYSEPEQKDGESNEEHKQTLRNWKREWAWRGIPLKIYERESDQDNKLKFDDGKPIVKYVEYGINHLFNLHLDFEKLVKQKRMTKEEVSWHEQDFKRLIGSEDQLSVLMKICTEKLIMMKIKEFIQSGKKWTADHTKALVDLLSSTSYYENKKGIRNLLLREKSGMFGLIDGPDEIYKGAGGWSRKEANNMVVSVVGKLRAYSTEPKDK